MSRARPRKGRRVNFSPADVNDPEPTSTTIAGLRFTIDAASGGTAIIDYVDLRPRRLAITFASALRELAPTVARSTVRQHACGHRIFFCFLEEEKVALDGPEDIRAAHIDSFENWLEAAGKTPIHRHTILAKAIIALRTIDASKPGLLDEQLQARLRYTSARPLGRSKPRDAYSSYVAKQLRDAARADVQAIAKRLKFPLKTDELSAELLQVTERVDNEIAQNGTVGYKHPAFRELYGLRRRQGLDNATLVDDLHARRYLTAEDIVPFFVLLSLETGLEPECFKALKADCLRNATNGTVEIAYMKRRARGSEHKTVRVRDGASSTPGGLVRLLLELTESARQHHQSDSLWLFFHCGRFMDVIRHPRSTIDNWTRRHGIVDDDGLPLRLLLSRLRKTHKALWYAKTGGDLTRFAIGHSPEVAVNHYADIPALRHLHEQTVADGLDDALTSALAPRIITPAEAPSADVATSINADAIVEPADSDEDVWLARCDGFTKSPFAEEGEPCPQPFWGCLECPNAVISAHKLPAIIAFHDFILSRRANMTEADWHSRFGRPWQRITKQILPAFSDAVIAEAREAALALEHRPYLPLEAHA